MSTRHIQFVGRRSGNPSVEVDLGEGAVKVKRGQVVEVDARVARELLRDPGASDDSQAEWVPASPEG